MLANPYILLTLAALGWGGNAVAGKLSTDGWQPFTIMAVRWLLVVAVILPFAWKHIKADKAILKERGHYLLGLGMFGMALFSLLMFLALRYTTAINVSIEQAAMPVMIILANFFIMSQRVHFLQIVGVIVSIAGVVITTSEGNPAQLLINGFNRGDAIMLLACVFYAGYTFGLRWRPNVNWLTFITYIASGAFIMCLPFALYEIANGQYSTPDLGDWLIVLYIIIAPSIVSQICFAKGVELIGGNRAGLFINLVPIFGSLLAVLILREQFHWFHAAGIVLVVGGIMMAERFAEKV